MKHEQVRVCEIIKRSVVQLCETGFASDNIQIRGVIGVTVNDSDVLVIHINEDITESDESPCQSCDKTLAESFQHRKHSLLNTSSLASALNSNNKSQVFPAASCVEHLNTNNLLPSLVSSCDGIKTEEIQDEHCNSHVFPEKRANIVDNLYQDDDCEMDDPELSSLHITNIVSSVGCFHACNGDNLSSTVKQGSHQGAFLGPVCDDMGYHLIKSLNNAELTHSGCMATNVSNVTLETQGPSRVDGLFDILSSLQSGVCGTALQSLSHSSGTDITGLPGKVSESHHIIEKLTTNNHAMESVLSATTSATSDERDNAGVSAQLLQALVTQNEEMKQVLFNTQLLQEIVRRQQSPTAKPCSLPLKSYEEVQDVEQKLKSKEFYSNMVSYLALIGGATTKVFISRAMTYLLDSELAKSFVWAKRVTKKHAFKPLELRKVLFDATLKNPLTSKATMDEVDDEVKAWIRGAPDRNGGRSERAKKAIWKAMHRDQSRERSPSGHSPRSCDDSIEMSSPQLESSVPRCHTFSWSRYADHSETCHRSSSTGRSSSSERSRARSRSSRSRDRVQSSVTNLSPRKLHSPFIDV